MEDLQLKTYIKTKHKNYIDMCREALESYKITPADETVMRNFYQKKATEYITKAEALWKVIEKF
jgi:hypothetical protein|tara:strand:+ start:67 stop:258 length:192 start_codon:yes stop_codon:yes gene_type:complete